MGTTTKFQVDFRRFLSAVKTGAKLCPNKCYRPMLRALHFRVAAGVCKIASTDGEVFLEQDIPCEMEMGATVCFCVDARTLLESIKSWKVNVLVLECDGAGKLSVNGGTSSVELLTGDPSDFPDKPEYKAESVIQIQNMDLFAHLSRCLPIMAQEQARYAINGILLQTMPGNALHAVATNGKRLIKDTSTYLGEYTGDTRRGKKGIGYGAIIPRQTAQLLIALLPVDGQYCEMTFAGRHVIFKGSDWTIVSMIVEGIFPSYEQVIPDHKFSDRIVIDMDGMTLALKQLAVIRKDPDAFFDFHFNGSCKVVGRSPSHGTAEATFPVDGNTDIEITMNPNYLDDIRKITTAKKVTMYLQNNVRSLLFSTGGSWQYVQMPISPKG